MKWPQVLNKIILEQGMNFSVLNPSMCCVEFLDYVCIVFRLDMIPIGDVPKVLWVSSIILDDHAVQYDATCHDLPEDLWLSILGRATKIAKRFKPTESSLNILSCRLLTCCKVGSLVASRTLNCLHKCDPWRIDVNGKVVPHRVPTAI
jgi:hypothetical protein